MASDIWGHTLDFLRWTLTRSSGYSFDQVPFKSLLSRAFDTIPTKDAVICVSCMTKIAGIRLISKILTSSLSFAGTSPMMARPFVSLAISLRTDAIRLHGRQVSL